MTTTHRVSDIAGWPGWTFALGVAEGDRETVNVTAPPGVHITPSRWREIPIGAVLNALRKRSIDAALRQRLAKLGAVPKRPHGGSDEHRRRVSDVYRLAVAHGVKPLDLIRSYWDLTTDPKTPIRWVREARDAGLLGSNAEERERAKTDPFWGIGEPDPFDSDEAPRARRRRVPGKNSTATRKDV